ncbi:MAG TPA: tetratricopeptide repeat protein [Terriglobales bacterium]|nr:tetratricopeptide repeat protein [Terriglobales bacterium]
MSRILVSLALAAALASPALVYAQGQDPAPPASQDSTPSSPQPADQAQKKSRLSRLKDKFSSGCVVGIGCWGDTKKPDSEAGQQKAPEGGSAPSSRPVPADQSSSRGTQIDLGPPSGSGAKPAGGVQGTYEMTLWDPHRAAKDIEVGDLYRKQGNYRAAVSRYRDALDYKPNDAEATFRMAETLEKLGEVEDAAAYYQSYLRILPRGDYAAASHQALARLEPLLGDRPPQARSGRGEEDLQLGEFYLALTNYPAAAQRFVHALQLDPYDSMAHLRLALALERMGRAAEAHEQYEAYLELLPRGPFASDVRKELAKMGPVQAPPVAPPKPDLTPILEAAEHELDAGNYAAAAERARQVLAVEAENPRALFRLAQALEGMGQREQALAGYQHYLKVDPNGPYSVPALLALDRLAHDRTAATSPPSQNPR